MRQPNWIVDPFATVKRRVSDAVNAPPTALANSAGIAPLAGGGKVSDVVPFSRLTASRTSVPLGGAAFTNIRASRWTMQVSARGATNEGVNMSVGDASAPLTTVPKKPVMGTVAAKLALT